jgi:hypothetical protein
LTYQTHRALRILIAGSVGAAALFWSGNMPPSISTSLVSTAEAIIGRPATPMSYAGVARRTTRRAVTYGAAAGAAAAAATTCRQVVDAYGRIVTVC